MKDFAEATDIIGALIVAPETTASGLDDVRSRATRIPAKHGWRSGGGVWAFRLAPAVMTVAIVGVALAAHFSPPVGTKTHEAQRGNVTLTPPRTSAPATNIATPGSSQPASVPTPGATATPVPTTAPTTGNITCSTGCSASAWGLGSSGQLGSGTTSPSKSAAGVNGLSNVRTIASGNFHGLAITADGGLWVWGSEIYGQLGNGVATGPGGSVQPTPIKLAFNGATAIAGGEYTSEVLRSDGTVWMFGYGADGELGNGSTSNSSTPVQVRAGNCTCAGGGGYLNNVVAIASGAYFEVALRTDGSVWTWGKNQYHELGDGTTTNRPQPVQVAGIGPVVKIYTSDDSDQTMIQELNGSFWGWGADWHGELCDGNSGGSVAAPEHLPAVDTVDPTSVSPGAFHTLLLAHAGTVFACGANDVGQIGDGTSAQRLLPVQVAGLTGIISIAAGDEHSVAVRSDGTGWTWGNNDNGELGNGTSCSGSPCLGSRTPVQAIGVHGAVFAAAGSFHSLVLTR